MVQKLFLLVSFSLFSLFVVGCESENEFVTLWAAFPSDHILSITVDKNNNVWAGGTAGRIFQYNGTLMSTWDKGNTDGVLPEGGWVGVICVDSNNGTWFSIDGKLYSHHNSRWTEINLDSILPSLRGVHDICCDKNGVLWFGGLGLGRFDGSSWTYFDSSASEGNVGKHIQNVCSDSKGNLWFHSASRDFVSEGIVLYDGLSWTKFNASITGLPFDDVDNIISNSRGVWFNTPGGVILVEGTVWSKYQPISIPGDLETNQIVLLGFDRVGEPWVMRRGSSLNTDTVFRVSNNNWQRLTSNEVNLGKFTPVFVADKNNHKWFGYSDTEEILRYIGN